MIICFDLDGTLVNTEKWVNNSMREAFETNNLKYDQRKIHAGWGLTIHDLIKKKFPKVTPKKRNKIVNDFEKIRLKNMVGLKPYRNTKVVLKTLSKKYSLALVSNNQHAMINRVLRKVKIDRKLFDVVVGKDEVAKPKPFPNEIKKAEKKLKKKAIFMIGDSKPDIITAKKAKIKSIIIPTGAVPKKDLKDADFIVKNIKDILKIIKEEECHNT